MTRKTQLLELAFTQWSSYAHAGAEFPQGPSRDGSVLVGARNVRQLRQNLDAYEAQVPADVLARLEELSAGLRDQMGTT